MNDTRRLVILADGMLDFHHGKTATSLLRYRPEAVVAVIDTTHAGMTTNDILGIAGDTPIVANIDGALPHRPTTLLIGIAPRGGSLPVEWRSQILTAMRAGLDIVSGLHYMLSEDAEFAAAARAAGVTIADVRRPPEDLSVALLTPRRSGARVLTFVGSDCAVGKMTAALEITAAAERRNLSVRFVATGQTGIMLEGSGIAIDRCIGDFMAGAMERLVLEAAAKADWIFVEGQGSLLHPAYSGVTLALLHGSAPDGMILVHPPTRLAIEEYQVKIPSVPELVEMYEVAAGWIKPARVLGIALNTRELGAAATSAAIEATERETGLPTTDPVKFGGEKLVDAVVTALATGQVR